MSVIISINYYDAELQKIFNTLKERIRNLKPAMTEVGQIVRSSAVKNFVEGGRPNTWRPHAYSTIMGSISGKDFTKKSALRKPSSRRLSAGKVLIDTARLQNSITAKAFSDRAEIGTSVIYGAIHQFGGKAGRGKKVTIPARPFLMFQNEDWTEIKAAINDYLTRGLK